MIELVQMDADVIKR